MEFMNFNCRECKKETKHLIRIVDDRLPKYVKALQCVKCTTTTMELINEQ
jgi:hypothetical protein